MIKKLQRIFDKKSLVKIILLIIGLVVLALLETLSISSIPLFISFIISPDLFLEKLSNLDFVPNIVLGFFIKYKSLFFINLIVITLFVSKNIYYSFITYAQGYILRDVISKVSNKLFSNYMFSEYENIKQNNTAIVLNNLTSEIGQCFAFLNAFALIIRESVVLFLLFSLVFLLNPAMTILIFLIFLLVSLIYFFVLKKKLNEIGKSTIKFKKEFLQSINESLGLFTDAKLLNKENYFINNFKSKNHGMYKTQHHRSFLSQMPRPILEITSVIVLLGLTMMLFKKNISTENIIPTLTFITVIALRLIPTFNIITSSMTLMRSFYPSLDLIDKEFKKFEFKKNFKKNFSKSITLTQDENLASNKNIIELKNLSFSYNLNDKKVLNETQVFIKKNKFISIVGESGSGKSTLIMIILGLLEPRGEVYYHSSIIDSKNNNLKIGYVPQSIFLKDDTIKNNIALGIDEKNIDIEKIQEVVKLSQLNDLVSDLEKGIETIVGERGSKLSGGQIQRIGLARALYNDPEVLVLDEATNALDIVTEKKIIDILVPMKNKKTVIMITHRTWDMKIFDSIIEVKDGKCSEIKLDK